MTRRKFLWLGVFHKQSVLSHYSLAQRKRDGIVLGINEIESKSCLRFRQWRRGDANGIFINNFRQM